MTIPRAIPLFGFGDIELELRQLASLEVFSSIKKLPAFEKFPGTTRLRHYLPGEVICHQSQPGKSAFYMLTSDDLRNLSGEGSTENAPEDSPGVNHPQQTIAGQLEPVRQLYQKLKPILAGESTSSSEPRRLASAILLREAKGGPRTNMSLWARTAGRFWKTGSRVEPEQLQSIPNDGPTDIDYLSGQAAIFEGEVFGEMSCLTRQPRSATIKADKEDIECFTPVNFGFEDVDSTAKGSDKVVLNIKKLHTYMVIKISKAHVES